MHGHMHTCDRQCVCTRVSSSGLRKLVSSGRVSKAAKWLSRHVEVCGVVQRGEGRGNGIGFPTANISLEGQFHPALGVYAVYGRLGISEEQIGGVANLGVRPTFESKGVAPRLEVHLFDPPFTELYGEQLNVEFIEQLRGEKKFDSVEELRGQIQRDLEASKKLISEFERKLG